MKSAVSQRGATLIVALLILAIISVTGLLAMRSSIFSNRVATGVQLDALAFEAAESAVFRAMNDLTVFNDSDDAAVFDQVIELFNGETIVWCELENGVIKNGPCDDDDYLDSRGLMLSESRSKATGFSPVSGNQVSTAGGSGFLFADFELSIQGNGRLPGYGLENRHVQKALRRGMIPAKDIE